MKEKEKNSEKVDTKVTPSILKKIVDRAEKERRNKSEMIRILIEDSLNKKIT